MATWAAGPGWNPSAPNMVPSGRRRRARRRGPAPPPPAAGPGQHGDTTTRPGAAGPGRTRGPRAGRGKRHEPDQRPVPCGLHGVEEAAGLRADLVGCQAADRVVHADRHRDHVVGVGRAHQRHLLRPRVGRAVPVGGQRRHGNPPARRRRKATCNELRERRARVREAVPSRSRVAPAPAGAPGRPGPHPPSRSTRGRGRCRLRRPPHALDPDHGGARQHRHARPQQRGGQPPRPTLAPRPTRRAVGRGGADGGSAWSTQASPGSGASPAGPRVVHPSSLPPRPRSASRNDPQTHESR